MAIGPGTRIGPYEVLSVLGAGGMGQVFRARDTKLNRDVALKVLPAGVDGDPDRLARFRREAQALAALNHPHIAAIYGFEDAGGVSALVLELVEGQTLAARILAGRLPLADALAIARQIAEAVEAAHEKGILHRDLKPANVSLTLEGRVKVLDFGLAKVLDDHAEGGDSTITAFGTAAGIVMGTSAYMSPEQARGEAVGRQADIWAFGAVLYELLTGVSAFGRQSTAETMAQVLNAQPDFARLRRQTPPAVSRLLRRCLEKNPRRRLQHIGDARIELEDAASSSESSIDGPSSTIDAAGRFRWLAVAALLLVVTAGLAGWALARGAATDAVAPLTRASLSFAEPPLSYAQGVSRIAISRDGSTVAYAGGNRLWIRRLEQKDPIAVGFGQDPFFSPDGLSLGFFADTELFRVPVTGGTPERITRHAGRAQGGAWSEDGTIVFASSEGLFRVPVAGGDPQLLKAPDRGRNETLYGWPELLPGGQSVMFTIVRDAEPKTEIATLDLATGKLRSAWTGGSFARRALDGQFVFATRTGLRAVGFDLDSRRSSSPVAIPDVEVGYAGDNGAADFALSATGTLVFIAPRGVGANELEWIDRMGRHETVALAPGGYFYPRISPDGKRVALDAGGGGNRDIWILDLARLSLSRLSDGPTEDLLANWSADGTRVFYSSNRNGNFDVYSQPADGAAPARPEYGGSGDQILDSITPDGAQLLIGENFGQKTTMLDLARRDRPVSLFEDRFEDRLLQVSHDGKWVAYESNESGGVFEILLRSFPDLAGRRVQISSGGGRYPKWGLKGSNELHYVAADGSMMAVPIVVGADVKVGAPMKLFDFGKSPESRSGLVYDISPLDGRFLAIKVGSRPGGGQTNVSVALNWTSELRRLLGD